jgi:hypothetical protein
MKKSDNIANLAKALILATRNIDPRVLKNALNQEVGNNYADLGAIIASVRGPLAEAGIVVIQSPTASARPNEIMLTTLLLHETGEWLEDTLTCPLEFLDPQGFGSAVSYVRRYALGAILSLFSADDDGQGATGFVRKPAQQSNVSTSVSASRVVEGLPADGTSGEGSSDGGPQAAQDNPIPKEQQDRVERWLKSCSNATLQRLDTSFASIRTTFDHPKAIEVIETAFKERMTLLRKAPAAA